jgi:hypothetical protein
MILRPSMSKKTPITVAHGDGSGSVIMEAFLRIVLEEGAQREIESIDVRETVVSRRTVIRSRMSGVRGLPESHGCRGQHHENGKSA